jgi:hypothetical protein
MSKNEIELEIALERLAEANTEDAIIEQLRSIVKGFNPFMYIDIIRENPYYTSLFEDVRQLVSEDITEMKKAIRDEIEAIDSEKKLDQEGMQMLSNLKTECNLLFDELIEKEREIMAINLATYKNKKNNGRNK